MIMQMSKRRSAPDKLLLAFNPFGRWVFIGIGLFLGLGMLLAGEFSVVMAVIGAVSVLAGLYNERWYFDRDSGVISHERWLIFPLRGHYYKQDDLHRVILRVVSGPGQLETFDPMKKGQPHIPKALRKGRAVLLLEFKARDLAGIDLRANPEAAWERIVLEDSTHRDDARLEGLGLAIAGYCGLPLDKGEPQTA